MSAKRRQEAIERFSVPLDDGDISFSTSHCPIPSKRSGNNSRITAAQGVDDDDSMLSADDSDFNFLDDDDDDTAFSSTQKSKGKGKAKAKAKATFRTKDFLPGENPKVMLLSLKCGSLGLNLTVANNVYL
jgi:SWI/SNF-related matrix-associated actin-dependent regulator of chromatin subfamily A3